MKKERKKSCKRLKGWKKRESSRWMWKKGGQKELESSVKSNCRSKRKKLVPSKRKNQIINSIMFIRRKRKVKNKIPRKRRKIVDRSKKWSQKVNLIPRRGKRRWGKLKNSVKERKNSNSRNKKKNNKS